MLDAANRPCPACAGAGATVKQRGFKERVFTLCPACAGGGVLPKETEHAA